MLFAKNFIAVVFNPDLVIQATLSYLNHFTVSFPLIFVVVDYRFSWQSEGYQRHRTTKYMYNYQQEQFSPTLSILAKIVNDAAQNTKWKMYIISLLLCHDLLYCNFPRFCTQSLFAWWGSLCYQTPTLQYTQISSKVRSVSVFTTWQCCISNLLPRSKLVLPASCVSSLKENCPLNSEGVGTVPQCIDVWIVTMPSSLPWFPKYSSTQGPRIPW